MHQCYCPGFARSGCLRCVDTGPHVALVPSACTNFDPLRPLHCAAGEYKQDHCQAHSSSYWDNLRKAARSGNTTALRTIFSSRLHSASNRVGAAAPAAAAPAPSLPAPAAAKPAGFVGAAEYLGAAARSVSQTVAWSSPKPVSAKREALSDPRRDLGMMHLGQLRLPVKAAKGTTIAQLKAKLAPVSGERG